MSKRKRLRKLLQSQAAAASKAPLPPGNILSIPTPPTPLVTSGSKQKAVDLLWEMLHRKLQSPDAMTDLHFLTKSIEKMLRIELAHRKQDHAERKLLLAEKKQELAARKFAFQQLKQQEKAASAVKPEEKTSPSSTAAGMESLPVAETPAAQPAENELPAPQPAPSKIVHIHYPSPATTTCDEAIPAELLA